MPTRLVVSSILACSCVAAVLAQYAPYEPAWNKPGTPHRIVGTIHYVGTTELAVYLIATPKGHILIDTGFEETVPIVRDSIRALGFRYEDIRVLLNTQAHYDHAAGLARVKRETGARLAAMREDAVLLEAGGKNDFRFGGRSIADRGVRDECDRESRHVAGEQREVSVDRRGLGADVRRVEVASARRVAVGACRRVRHGGEAPAPGRGAESLRGPCRIPPLRRGRRAEVQGAAGGTAPAPFAVAARGRQSRERDGLASAMANAADVQRDAL
jgi:hypothetical protein